VQLLRTGGESGNLQPHRALARGKGVTPPDGGGVFRAERLVAYAGNSDRGKKTREFRTQHGEDGPTITEGGSPITENPTQLHQEGGRLDKIRGRRKGRKVNSGLRGKRRGKPRSEGGFPRGKTTPRWNRGRKFLNQPRGEKTMFER